MLRVQKNFPVDQTNAHGLNMLFNPVKQKCDYSGGY